MAYSAAFLAQVAAAASIPLVFLGFLFSRVSRRKQFKFRQLKMTVLLSLVPALVLFGIRGVTTTWQTIGGGLVVVGAAMMVGTGGD